MFGIIFQQMSKCPGVCDIVYSHELYIFIFISGPENQPADSSKAINGNLYSHIILLTYFYRILVKSLVVVNAFLFVENLIQKHRLSFHMAHFGPVLFGVIEFVYIHSFDSLVNFSNGNAGIITIPQGYHAIVHLLSSGY